jgi:hypothetical protein
MLSAAGALARKSGGRLTQGVGSVRPDPAGRVVAPAIGLMASGGLNAAFTLISMLVVGLGGTAAIADPEARDALPGFGVLLAFGLFNLVLALLTLYAGWQMRQVQSWTLCMAGSIAAMLPCSVCCILGLPMGVWAMIVLIDNEVKQMFNGGGPPGEHDPPPGGYGDPSGGYGQPPGGYTPPPGGSPPPPGQYGGPPQPPPGGPPHPPQT